MLHWNETVKFNMSLLGWIQNASLSIMFDMRQQYCLYARYLGWVNAAPFSTNLEVRKGPKLHTVFWASKNYTLIHNGTCYIKTLDNSLWHNLLVLYSTCQWRYYVSKLTRVWQIWYILSHITDVCEEVIWQSHWI